VFVGAEDYPRDLLELESRFSTEAACRAYLFELLKSYLHSFLDSRVESFEYNRG
jgi:hypothetical protein